MTEEEQLAAKDRKIAELEKIIRQLNEERARIAAEGMRNHEQAREEVNRLHQWIGSPEIQAAFPDLDHALANERERVVEQLTRLRAMRIEHGGIHAEFEPPEGIVPMLAQALAEWLGDAPNYTESRLELQAAGYETKRYFLTVQRAEGKTPHELRKEAERRVDRLDEGIRGALDLLTGFHSKGVNVQGGINLLNGLLG